MSKQKTTEKITTPKSVQNPARTAGWFSILILIFGLVGAYMDGSVLVQAGQAASWLIYMAAILVVFAGAGAYLTIRRPISKARRIHEVTSWGVLVLLLIGYGMAGRNTFSGRQMSYTLNLMYMVVGGMIYLRFSAFPVKP